MKPTTLLSLLVCLSPIAADAALSVTPSDNGTTLTNSILGPGISLVGAPTYSGAGTGASGTFSGGTSAGIGIESGLILTTGLATNAIGPNTSGSITGPGTTTSLMFTFNTAGGDLFFNYVFASEEYNEYVFSAFNDKFRFLLDGVNIALIPSTSTPVEIDTVNNSVNSGFYNNNSPGPYNIQYDGFTDVFQAKALGLSAGNHVIELLIYDVGDSAYDSAVFIQGNSFSDTPTPPSGVPDGGATLMLLSSGLFGIGMLRRKFAV